MLVLVRRGGQYITATVGEVEIRIHVIEVIGGKARIGIEAPKSVRIIRDDAIVRAPKPFEGEVDDPATTGR